jgi:hypothetical protein
MVLFSEIKAKKSCPRIIAADMNLIQPSILSFCIPSGRAIFLLDIAQYGKVNSQFLHFLLSNVH